MPPFIQESVLDRMPIAAAGMPADADYHADTRICETAAGIAFGVAVSQGTSDKEALLGAAAVTGFVGVTIRDVTIVNNAAADKYPRYSNMAVMTDGDIWVQVGGDVTKGNDVSFSSTTGVLSTAATSGTQFAIAGARWMTSASNGGFAILRLTGALPNA
jgi:hypothetical protein